MVKRYELCFYEGIAASDSGSFVLYDDYAALEKQLAELQDKLRWRDVREELPADNSYIIIQTKSGEIPAYWSGFAKNYKHKEAVVFNSRSFKRFIFWRYATHTADKHEAS